MILNARFKRPVISFGLSLTMLSCEIGDDVTVYVNDVYNENEFVLIQNETAQVITMTYMLTSGPEILQANFSLISDQVNGRNAYFNGTDFFFNAFIVWDGEKWRFINGIVVPTESPGVGILNTDSLIPIGNWEETGSNIIPFTTTSNVTSQSFTFPATESKDIQIEMRKKTGELLISNKIQLTVNTSE